MNIKQDSKKIVQHILNHIVKYGLWEAAIPLHYNELVESLNMETENYCKICVSYLVEKGYIKNKIVNGNSIFSITASGIDFLDDM